MDTFLSKMMSKYPDGYPPLDPGNLPGPDDQYELSADRIGMRRSTKPSQPFNFMRHGAVCNVVIKMKNNNKTVVKVSAKNSPTSQKWTNDASIMWEFLSRYCGEEGVEQTSKLFPKLVNYVLHGRWNVTRKVDGKKTVVGTKPFLSGLHYKLVNGRTRYHKECLERFETFVSLYDRNPSWTVFFDDKGEGSPPSTYLAAIEEGLRNYTVDPFTMGRDALSSKKKWASVAPWRKREAYVTLCRILLKRTAYRK